MAILFIFSVLSAIIIIWSKKCNNTYKYRYVSNIKKVRLETCKNIRDRIFLIEFEDIFRVDFLKLFLLSLSSSHIVT